MISSLVHILIVTPVIFLWLRGREFRKGRLSFNTSPA
jgi:Cu(I)/Ag(I) efflux system membrane protein CusA/SilA